jgi:hypothetical protein
VEFGDETGELVCNQSAADAYDAIWDGWCEACASVDVATGDAAAIALLGRLGMAMGVGGLDELLVWPLVWSAESLIAEVGNVATTLATTGGAPNGTFAGASDASGRSTRGVATDWPPAGGGKSLGATNGTEPGTATVGGGSNVAIGAAGTNGSGAVRTGIGAGRSCCSSRVGTCKSVTKRLRQVRTET